MKVSNSETVRDALLRERQDTASPLSLMSEDGFAEFLTLTCNMTTLLSGFPEGHLKVLGWLVGFTLQEKEGRKNDTD